ncbi:MAG: L-2-hydroxyglutarate oxidase [Acidimicrobiia bacterium]|nr:L-2-hydroxyglutarate oxidase [Acidimicrobiia bacterium]
MNTYDVCVIGGGIIGLATATAIARRLSGCSIAVLEKEPSVGAHQTGHNSGVLHSGLYYKPGSLKARLCVEGQRQMAAYCEEHGLAFRRSGKIVVASYPHELPAMEELYRRGIENGLEGLRRLSSAEIREIEPHATGVAALSVPEAGVVDYPAVTRHLASGLQGDVILGFGVSAIANAVDGVTISSEGSSVRAKFVVNTAGLHSDRVARMAGVEPPVQIIPFRGEYYTLTPDAASLVNALIYPVPDPRFPFLGVHFTRRVDGSVEVGPNAVLALGREHYRGSRPNAGDVAETLRYAGFRKLVGRYWRTGAAEAWRSARRSTYARSARVLVPSIQPEHLETGGAGIRAQAVTPDGALVDDFSIVQTDSAVHVLNAPSPGATASLAIGSHIAALVAQRLGGGSGAH